jgi:hypothetical protein
VGPTCRHPLLHPHPHVGPQAAGSNRRRPLPPTVRRGRAGGASSARHGLRRQPRASSMRELHHGHELRTRETGERQRGTGEEKLERSGSVPRILRDGANPHIRGIFSWELLRSRRSPSKQPRAPLQSHGSPTKHTVILVGVGRYFIYRPPPPEPLMGHVLPRCGTHGV